VATHDEERRELLSELDNEWHTLRHGNPVPGLYPQTGTEIAKVRGSSRVEGDRSITTYEIIVTERGEVVGRYRVVAEEAIADYDVGYGADERE
jgi:hypothetical protein